MESSVAEMVTAAVRTVDKFSVWRSAFERATRVAVSGGMAFVFLSAADLISATTVWAAPLVAAMAAFLSSVSTRLMGAEYKGSAGSVAFFFALRTAIYVAPPSILVVTIWPAFTSGSLAQALAVGGSAGVLALSGEFAAVALDQGGSVVAQEVRSKAAEEAVLATEGPDQVDTDGSDVSAVQVDAQLAYRYQRARQDAEDEVRSYLPANPRTAKRMVNHISLGIAIAEQRGLFDSPTITRQHLRKWIGISEQWPALATALTAAPERIADLEKAGLPELRRLIDELAPGTLCSDELRLRLKEGVPLGDILPQLVQFELRLTEPPGLRNPSTESEPHG
ncbi:hypothetical protein DMA12_24305 [Amycolatopsis balhimycina DSM 5908]|uniref:Uncharacterized protein n=1 Tax=Amycolatopsis balhimycina DSM 5908 TaxID=1081091 RepID=A0A428WEH4_AMYBA|nr:hypothetical protein [Amycolatopsis balhimycina]RSM41447.1 hypothetical protein DMA12_24305 [Amycolatopsis balhimycina DSM 5908]